MQYDNTMQQMIKQNKLTLCLVINELLCNSVITLLTVYTSPLFQTVSISGLM